MYPDLFTPYETAMQQLLEHVGSTHARYADALLFQSRLLENIALVRRYGATEPLRHQRAQLVDDINTLAQEVGYPPLPPVRIIPHETTLEQRNRSRMLEKVRVSWITGFRESSLHGEVGLVLGLEPH